MKIDYPSFIRTIPEETAFSQRHCLEVVLDRAARPNTISPEGGAASSPLWCRIFAGVLGMPVARLRPNEIETLGDIIIAAQATGIQEIAPDFGKMLTAKGEVFQPDDARAPVYDRQYRAYRELYQALKPVLTGGGE